MKWLKLCTGVSVTSTVYSVHNNGTNTQLTGDRQGKCQNSVRREYPNRHPQQDVVVVCLGL